MHINKSVLNSMVNYYTIAIYCTLRALLPPRKSPTGTIDIRWVSTNIDPTKPMPSAAKHSMSDGSKK